MKVVLKNVILAYPRLFVPAEFKKSPAESDPAKAKYSATILIDPETVDGADNVKKIREAIKTIEKETWKEKVPKSVKVSFVKGNEQDYEAFEPYFVLSASDRFKPLVVGRDNTEIKKEDSRSELIRSGTIVNAVVTGWGMNNSYGNRVCFNIKGVQYVKEGEIDLGGENVAKDFDELEVDESGFEEKI